MLQDYLQIPVVLESLKLIIACCLGSLIGLEREWKGQPAGLRTHIVLCMGSCLYTMISIEMINHAIPGANADPGRIAAQIVSGIGFLGAGAIMRLGVSIKGLTTAASLWTTAAIGLSVGAGYFEMAFLTTFIMLLTLVLLKPVESLLFRRTKMYDIAILIQDDRETYEKVMGQINDLVTSIQELSTSKDLLSSRQEIKCIVKTRDTMSIRTFEKSLMGIEGVFEVIIH